MGGWVGSRWVRESVAGGSTVGGFNKTLIFLTEIFEETTLVTTYFKV